MSGGGEFLRGVLSQNLRVSRWKSYKIEIATTPGSTRSGNVKINSPSSFLCTQFNVDTYRDNFTTYNFSLERFTVEISKTSFRTSLSPVLVTTNVSNCVNQTYSLPSYLYVEGNEYLNVTVINNDAINRNYSFVFTGVEYLGV